MLIGEQPVLLARYEGSFFGLRAAVEPVVAEDEPDLLILYLPGVGRNRETSALMELERGGTSYEPQLKRLARDALRPFCTESDIDAMVESEALTYEDVVGFLEQAASGEKASILKTVLPTDSDQGLLVRWLADDGHDAGVVEKGAVGELYRLIEARLGLSLTPETPVGEARAKTARYLLVNEFRADLEGEPPTSLGMVPVSSSNGCDARIREVNSALRRQHPDFYTAFADRVEADLDLDGSGIDPRRLGATDTFRFEESSLLAWAIELTAAKQYDAALAIVVGRAHSFWLEHHVARRAQWEACRLAVELGQEIARVTQALEGRVGDSTAWVNAYTAKGGWFEVDRLQRRLETWMTRMDSEPKAEQAVAVVRRDHDELLKRMADGFWSALAGAGWAVPRVLHQTQIYPQVVQSGGPRVAYFLIDAMRYEMGVELADQLQGVRGAVGAPRDGRVADDHRDRDGRTPSRGVGELLGDRRQRQAGRTRRRHSADRPRGSPEVPQVEGSRFGGPQAGKGARYLGAEALLRRRRGTADRRPLTGDRPGGRDERPDCTQRDGHVDRQRRPRCAPARIRRRRIVRHRRGPRPPVLAAQGGGHAHRLPRRRDGRPAPSLLGGARRRDASRHRSSERRGARI